MSDEQGGSVADLTVQILRSIRDEIGGLRVEMREEIGGLRREMHEGFTGLRIELHQGLLDVRKDLNELEQQAARGFTAMRAELTLANRQLEDGNRRVDHALLLSGGGHRDHEARLATLERRMDRVDPPAGPPSVDD